MQPYLLRIIYFCFYEHAASFVMVQEQQFLYFVSPKLSKFISNFDFNPTLSSFYNVINNFD